jgi:hypothetical protein
MCKLVHEEIMALYYILYLIRGTVLNKKMEVGLQINEKIDNIITC